MQLKGKAYFLERLNDFLHVNELAIVGLEWKIDIDASDIVRRHLFCTQKDQNFALIKWGDVKSTNPN